MPTRRVSHAVLGQGGLQRAPRSSTALVSTVRLPDTESSLDGGRRHGSPPPRGRRPISSCWALVGIDGSSTTTTDGDSGAFFLRVRLGLGGVGVLVEEGDVDRGRGGLGQVDVGAEVEQVGEPLRSARAAGATTSATRWAIWRSDQPLMRLADTTPSMTSTTNAPTGRAPAPGRRAERPTGRRRRHRHRSRRRRRCAARRRAGRGCRPPPAPPGRHRGPRLPERCSPPTISASSSSESRSMWRSRGPRMSSTPPTASAGGTRNESPAEQRGDERADRLAQAPAVSV